MSPERFIAKKLKFQGSIAAISIAVSFLVMILSIAITSGFRHTVRDAVSQMTGDIRISPNPFSTSSSVPRTLPSEAAILQLPGVVSLTPVVYLQGIVRADSLIHGVLVKGVPAPADSSLAVSIPERLQRITGLGPGDTMTTYFIGEKVRVRRFRITDVHRDLLEMDDNLIVYAPLADMQRLAGFSKDEVSAVEVGVRREMHFSGAIEQLSRRIGNLLFESGAQEEENLVTQSCMEAFPSLFDWLGLLDFNVGFLLILMVLVAGFNMISGLLIVLFRKMATIGTLKTLGMTPRSIGKVFLHVSSGVVLKGMLVGNALALVFCLIQGTTHLIPLDPANYFVSWVPVHVDIPKILLVDLLSYGAIMLLLLIPTLFIARIDPAKTVRAQ